MAKKRVQAVEDSYQTSDEHLRVEDHKDTGDETGPQDRGDRDENEDDTPRHVDVEA